METNESEVQINCSFNDNIQDEDEDTFENVSKFFKREYCEHHKESVSLSKAFIRYSACTDSFSKFSIGFENEMQVYDVTPTGFNKYVGKNDFGKFDRNVSGIEFFKNDPNLLLVSTICGSIYMYDLRTFKLEHTFEDDTEILIKPVTCVSVNANNEIVCAGSEEINKNVYLMFFDIRERRLMGAFNECHTEEITDVKFHPSNPNKLATGSCDGLINVFDTSQTTEEDALQYCLNTECSVDTIKWHKDEQLSCITNTNNLHLYDMNEQELLVKWDRKAITAAMYRKVSMECNVIDCHSTNDNIMCMSTSYHNYGDCLRGLEINKKSLNPAINFVGNRQIVRTSLYNANEDVYFTFGENGFASVWKEGSATIPSSSTINPMKHESKVKMKMKTKSNPY